MQRKLYSRRHYSWILPSALTFLTLLTAWNIFIISPRILFWRGALLSCDQRLAHYTMNVLRTVCKHPMKRLHRGAAFSRFAAPFSTRSDSFRDKPVYASYTIFKSTGAVSLSLQKPRLESRYHTWTFGVVWRVAVGV